MWQALQRLNKNLVLAIPTAMLAGFGFGMLFEAGFLKHLIIPITFIMVYPMMIGLRVRSVLHLGNPKPLLAALALNFTIIPLAAYALGSIFFFDQPYVVLGFVLMGVIPTSGMTISWTGFARGNVESAVKMTVVGLVLGALAAPFYVQALMGAELDLDLARVARQIAFIVLVPLAAGIVTRLALIRRYGQQAFAEHLGPKLPVFSTLGVLGIVFIAVALKARGVAAEPAFILYALVPLAAFYLLNYALGTAIGRRWLSGPNTVALVFGTAMRNLSIALAVAINAFGPEGSSAALLISVAYVLQVQSAVWYVRCSQRLCGIEPSVAAETAGS